MFSFKRSHLFERDRVHEQEEEQREVEADSPLSREHDGGAPSQEPAIMTRAEVSRLTDRVDYPGAQAITFNWITSM